MKSKSMFVKVLSLCLMVLMLLSVTACSSKTDTKPKDDKPAAEEKKDEGKAENKGSDEKQRTLTAIVAGLTEDSPSGKALKEFAKLVEKYSNGSLKIDTFFNTELGSVVSCVDSCAQGTLDIVSTGTSYFSGYVPAIQVFELPFIFDTYDEAHKTLDDKPGQKVAELFNGSGLKLLCYWESGMRHVTSNKRQIKTVDDMKGQKIRTVVSATQQATWEAFGALPMALDMGEVFTALQNGTVDAQENTLSSISTYKMYEAQKYLSMTYHSYTPMPFIINEKVWNELSPEQQEAVQKASEEARDEARKLNAEGEAADLKLIADKGVEVEEHPDRESFKARVQPVYDIFNESINDDSLLKMVQDYVSGLRK